MIKWIFFGFFCIIFSFVAYLLFHLGVYKSPKIFGPETKTFQLLYVEHIGPYYKVNDTITRVEKWAHAHGIPCTDTFGEYIDNPRMVASDRLRSHAGCVVAQPPVRGKDWPSDFHFEVKKPRLYLHLSFDGSPSISPYRVYPAAGHWTAKHHYMQKGAIIEVYTRVGKEGLLTNYYFPVSKSP